jgi:hypothetical protein
VLPGNAQVSIGENYMDNNKHEHMNEVKGDVNYMTWKQWIKKHKVKSGWKHYLSKHKKKAIVIVLLLLMTAQAYAYTDEQIADAIYIAEGGAKTRHPYGILKKYKTTTPRQACINTIKHARRDWNGEGDFIEFLGSRYCPVNCDNDNGTNQYWIRNVKWILKNSKKS